MKKITILTLLLLSMMVSAAPRNIRQARRAVSHLTNLQHAYTAVQPDGQSAFYVFNKPDGQGFVIVSADDRAYTILGYSDSGRWDENEMPDNLRAWLDGYKSDLESLDQLSDYMAQNASTAAYTPVAPICKTQWNQKTPYNDLCPSYQTGHAATGCVATAAAQIMKYHAYPAHGVGSHSYKWVNENGDTVTLSADFASTTYDWANMLNTYSSTATQTQKDAVATLMYQCGVSCNMKYGKSSSATTSTMARELINTFSYDKSLRPLYKDYAGEEVLLSAIQADLLAGRPVLMRGRTVNDEGHAFVCDGIDADGLVHINWGWGGKSDGYFRLSALAPSSQGTGGSSSNKAYTENVQIFTGIRPDAGGDYALHLICENVRIRENKLSREDTVKFVVDTLRNRGYGIWKGNLRLYIYQNGQLYKTRSISSNLQMKSWTVYYSRSYNAVISYPPGEYEIVMSIRSADDEEAYVPLYCRGVGEWRCSMTITNDSIFINQKPPYVPQAIETAESQVQPKVQKILRNGVLYIRREGETYTLQGVKVSD